MGNGGTLRAGTPHEVATEVSLNTAHGVERWSATRSAGPTTTPRKHVTLVRKHNVLVYAGHLWKRTVEAVAQEFPDVTHDYLHIDAATIFMVTDPARFDVIVTDNLFGDIITDLGAVTGGIGLAASGNINMDRTRRPCSNRSTDRRRTLPASRRRTPRRPSSPPRSCWTTWATAAAAEDRGGGDRRRRRPQRRIAQHQRHWRCHRRGRVRRAPPPTGVSLS